MVGPIRILAVIAVLFVAGSGRPLSASHHRDSILVVIVHPSNRVATLNALELNALFTSNRRFWPDGKAIVVFNAPPRSPPRVLFDRVVLDMNPDQVGRFWVDQQVRGRARPPRTVQSPRLAHAAVKRLPNAIAYISVHECPRGVRVVAALKNGRVLHPSEVEGLCQ